MRSASAGDDDRRLMCPSADAAPGNVVFAARTGDQEIGYLDELVPVTASLLALAEPVDPRQVFRFGGACAEAGCQHFAGNECSLGSRIARRMDPVVSGLPACRLRNRCRWYAEQGASSCTRCPAIITLRTAADETFAEVVRPVHERAERTSSRPDQEDAAAP